MRMSHDDLVKILNENTGMEVIVAKEIIDNIETDPKKILNETGREYRNAVEYKYDAAKDMAYYADKIVFSVKETS